MRLGFVLLALSCSACLRGQAQDIGKWREKFGEVQSSSTKSEAAAIDKFLSAVEQMQPSDKARFIEFFNAVLANPQMLHVIPPNPPDPEPTPVLPPKTKPKPVDCRPIRPGGPCTVIPGVIKGAGPIIEKYPSLKDVLTDPNSVRPLEDSLIRVRALSKSQ